jgi:excisionase family DNA binding protein
VNPIKLSDVIMGTEEAAELWGVTQDHIKKLCRLGKCDAIRIGKTWVLARKQDKPLKKSKTEVLSNEDIN